LKVIEAVLEQSVLPTSHFVIRIDGVCFSTFTKGIQKPFDSRLTHAMVKTTVDLVSRFQAVMGYHQSDEISLVFEAADVEEMAVVENKDSKKRKRPGSHPYGGRVQKLVSTAASYAAARLNYYLARYLWDDVTPQVAERMKSSTAYFDGRVVPCDDANSVMEAIYWRSNVDGLKNAISMIANYHFKHTELQSKSTKVKLDMLEEKGIRVFEDYSLRVLFGTWVKKEEYLIHDMLHPKTKQPLPHPVVRFRYRVGSFDWSKWSDADRLNFLFAKIWLDGDNMPPKDLLLENGAAIDHSNLLVN
jgi:tRNA(His) 5'-end guanylyltransferase